MLMFSRPRCMPSWNMHFKFVWMLDQKIMLTFSLRARRLRKLFRLPKQLPHWYNSTKWPCTTFSAEKNKILHGNPAYMAKWRGLISTHTQDRIFISRTTPTAKNRLLSYKRTQSRVVADLLTGYNT
jgi:hypothetical protein